MKISVKSDENEKKAEEKQLELEYKVELDKAIRREEQYEVNLHKMRTKS